jgi:hypothetical protein
LEREEEMKRREGEEKRGMCAREGCLRGGGNIAHANTYSTFSIHVISTTHPLKFPEWIHKESTRKKSAYQPLSFV